MDAPPIREPIISKGILSPIWAKWFLSLSGGDQDINVQSSQIYFDSTSPFIEVANDEQYLGSFSAPESQDASFTDTISGPCEACFGDMACAYTVSDVW